MLPDTVPDCIENPFGNCAWVLLAGTVKLIVRDPFVNTTAGSSRGTTASVAKVMVRVPAISIG